MGCSGIHWVLCLCKYLSESYIIKLCWACYMLGWIDSVVTHSVQYTYLWFFLPDTLSALLHPYVCPKCLISLGFLSLSSSFRVDSSRLEGERSMKSGNWFLPAYRHGLAVFSGWWPQLLSDSLAPLCGHLSLKDTQSTLSSHPFSSRYDAGTPLALDPKGCTKAWDFPIPHPHLCQKFFLSYSPQITHPSFYRDSDKVQ